MIALNGLKIMSMMRATRSQAQRPQLSLGQQCAFQQVLDRQQRQGCRGDDQQVQAEPGPAEPGSRQPGGHPAEHEMRQHDAQAQRGAQARFFDQLHGRLDLLRVILAKFH